MLADPYRLEGEGAVAWSKPSVLPDPVRVNRVLDELERGLKPTRPEFLKWICDKLSALPTQTSTGLNAALWTDNVIDVCERYPEDLLQTACLELLRSCTFRPSPAEIVKAIDDRFEERKRMLDRAKQLLPENAPKPGQAFVAEPEAVRLRVIIDRALAAQASGSFLAAVLMPPARRAEVRLAEIEGRAPADWTIAEAVTVDKPKRTEPRIVADGYDAVPEGENFEAAA